MAKIDVAPEPCGTCPYRRDVPAGLWDASEYEKLPTFAEGYDAGQGVPCLALFLCHQTHRLGRDTACRGWLSVERESLAVRLAVLTGRIAADEVWREVKAPLYESGREAAEAGLAGVEEPSLGARRAMARLQRKGIGR